MKKKLKKLIAILLIISTTSISLGEGNGNIDSGGSGSSSGSGDSQYCWYSGDDGVRISIVDKNKRTLMRTPIDFTNKSRKDIKYHFGKVSKIEYVKNGKSISLYNGGYNYTIPPHKLPTIISRDGNNIEAIKKYFTSKKVLEVIAASSNMDYEELVGGQYKLLLEPIVYITSGGKRWAMTATEVALYNKKSGGAIRRHHVTVSHKRLPFSMFLETSDFGFPAYKGSTSKPASDDTILQQLGLGIVRFNNEPEEPVEPDETPVDTDTVDYEYRTDTDVISSITLTAGGRITPDAPASVTFKTPSGSHTVSGIVIPEGGSQIVWVKWHTPKTPQKVTIPVSISGASASSSKITANVVDLEEKTPPDPLATDRNDSWKLENLPTSNNKTSASWGVWDAEWKEDWQTVYVGKDEDGNSIYDLVDLGDWEYTKTTYSADLTATLSITPGLRTPTRIEKKGEYEMKSGYGVNAKLNTKVTYNCSTSDVTSAQNSVAVFSEFGYKTYNRVLQITKDSGYSDQFEFKKNRYSTYNDRTHFTPIWYKDETNYIVNADVIDVWTPVGMLRATLSDRIMINGNLNQDRHIAILK